MENIDFRSELIESVRIDAAAEGEGQTVAFIDNMCEYLAAADILPDFTHAYCEGRTRQRAQYQTNGFYLDESDNTLTLIIADFGGGEPRTLVRTEAAALFNRLERFVQEALQGGLNDRFDVSHIGADLVELIRLQHSGLRRYRFLLLTDAEMSARIKSLEVSQVADVEVEYQIWDLTRVQQIAESQRMREEITIDFSKRLGSAGLPCLAVPSNSDEYQSYLCVMPGELLADIYDEYGGRLLEGNVRSFLSATRQVNKSMRLTIRREPNMFLAYNNGIAATARQIETVRSGDQLYLKAATDLQIINGGQTTASLSNARFKDHVPLDQISVQMKLTEVDTDDQEAAARLIATISRSSNSQTKVSEADFASLHPFHIRMEQYSRSILAPPVGGAQHGTRWFYERAAGAYTQAQMKLTSAAKKTFLLENPKKQRITKTDLAKSRYAWEGHPDIVSKGAQANFRAFNSQMDAQWSKNDAFFNEQYFKDTVALLLLFHKMEKMVSSSSWYEGGYRANIVAYSMALLPRLIQTQFPGQALDLRRIWQNQAVPASLLPAIELVTHAVFRDITDDSLGRQNVTQWCKKPECWARVQKLEVTLPSQTSDALADLHDIEQTQKYAKKDQKLAEEVQYQEFVLLQAPAVWLELQTFAQTHRLLTGRDVTALKYALQIPFKYPTASQSKTLYDLWQRAELEGFASPAGTPDRSL